MLAIKRLHPEAHISVLCDDVSASHLHPIDAYPILELADNVDVVPCPYAQVRERNRFVKTSMRSRLKGDFLYLDADTIPIRPLDSIFQVVSNVGGVLEFNKSVDEHFFPEAWNELYACLGWKYPTSVYVNGGVLMFRDTPQAHRFGEEWHRRWIQSRDAGVSSDQPSLNSALFESGVDVTLLSNADNAMVLMEPWRFRGCRVAHFFESNEVGGTLMTYLVRRLMETGRFDETAIERCIAEGHPWMPDCEAWQLWRSRNYFRAVVAKGRQSARRCFDATLRRGEQNSGNLGSAR